MEVAQAGYGKTRKEVRHIAGRVAVDKERRKTSDVSPGWYQRFMQGTHICHIGRVIQRLMLE